MNVNSNKIILITGKPGAGKTAVGDLYADISCARKLVSSEILQNANFDISSGKLLPDEEVNKYLLTAIKEAIEEGSVVLDGFPRNSNQLEIFYKAGLKLDLMVLIEIEDREVLKRTKDRIVCENCKLGYTEKSDFRKPKIAGLCDSCSGRLVRRKDDLMIDRRLDEYRRLTEPMIETCKDVYKIPIFKVLGF